mmetsp:Transcript_6055/g.9473  ORF Transcript_6055/g.9473 Transcript_6055/m.9473 type:complete len:102 (+) Transcript_6055:95-400(+)
MAKQQEENSSSQSPNPPQPSHICRQVRKLDRNNNFICILIAVFDGIHVCDIVDFYSFACAFQSLSPLLCFLLGPSFDGSIDKSINLFLTRWALHKPPVIPK